MMERAMEMYFYYERNEISAEEFLAFCQELEIHPASVVAYAVAMISLEMV